MNDDLTADLIRRVRRGEPTAEVALFRRYEDNLVQMVRAKMSERMARAFDPEDVVQSAYKSLFGAIRADRYIDLSKGEFWKILAETARHKLFKRIERHQRRDELAAVTELPTDFEAIELQPTPDEIASVVDSFEACLRELDPTARQVIHSTWFEGQAIPEVAARVNRAERTVRRWCDAFRIKLLARLMPE